MKAGYGEQSFFAGPLVRAMRDGSILFINELNRMPESVQNVILPALDEGLLVLPRIGEVRAAAGFQVVATQNPVEYIATGHLSEALKDRFEHIPLLHQSEVEEREIVRRQTGCTDEALIADAVAIARMTRGHPRFRKGASVRAAVSIVAIASRLTSPERLRSAALTALATRVELRDEEDDNLAAALDEILEAVKKN
jgi:MoxR-like ATPase